MPMHTFKIHFHYILIKFKLMYITYFHILFFRVQHFPLRLPPRVFAFLIHFSRTALGA